VLGWESVSLVPIDSTAVAYVAWDMNELARDSERSTGVGNLRADGGGPGSGMTARAGTEDVEVPAAGSLKLFPASVTFIEGPIWF
jgi:hypothetical protein